MRNMRVRVVWSSLVVCGVMVLAAMTWLTRGVLESERTGAESEARADLGERTRLALWRMEVAGSAILFKENQRPPTAFRSKSESAEATGKADPLVNLHFQAGYGSLGSPEVHQASDRFAELRGLLAKNRDISDVLNQANRAWEALPKVAAEQQNRNTVLNNAGGYSKRAAVTYQQDSNEIEKVQRTKVIESQESVAAEDNWNAWNSFHPGGMKNILEIGSMRGVWIDEELFLLRHVKLGGGGEPLPVIQGVWANAANVKTYLLGIMSDLLPGADLQALTKSGAADAAGAASDDPLALASLPFRLVPPVEAVLPPLPWSKPLIVGWAAVILAILTTSVLVHGIMRLSERRASFVSAVTHELRTPLTTFRLYSDMLESGVIKPEKQGDYLRVLSREADRLSHLVENVLSFSKIERGCARSVVRKSSVEQLLDPLRERLESRLATAGMELTVDLDPVVADRMVRVDAASVEHILFNLIDNAAKYASAGIPPRVEITAEVFRHHVGIKIKDHGPGISSGERKRIFHAFHKSALEAAETRPGVGLGLALSRRLARSLGGGLECGHEENGACFILRLPLA